MQKYSAGEVREDENQRDNLREKRGETKICGFDENNERIFLSDFHKFHI